jgi:TetR/AcrR family transcriptional regulator
MLSTNFGDNPMTMNDDKISRNSRPARTRAAAKKRVARPKKKRREQQRAIDTRALILEAALTEFAQHGFEGASTRRIGERAGIQHPLITYHYRTKDILWRAVAEFAFAEIRETWDIRVPPDSSLSAVDRVREEFRAFLQFTIQHVDFHQFMLRESLPGSPRLKWLVKNMLQPTMDRLVPQIAEAQKDGGLPAGDPILFYYMLIGCMSVLSSLRGEMRATAGLDVMDSAVTESYWRLVDATIFGR